MNEAPPTLQANTPSRPDLFLRSPAGAANPPSKRISVLASLDTKPAPKRKNGRGARWSLASLLILTLAGVGGWLIYANNPTTAAVSVTERSSAAPAVPEHAAPLATPIAPHEAAQATLNMPASIEDLPAPVPSQPPQTALSAPAAAGTGLAAALAAPAAANIATATPAAASAPAETQAAQASGLLSALAAPSAKPKADVKAESKTKTPAKATTHKDVAKNVSKDRITDTDVILLEALVAHSARHTDGAPAPAPTAAATSPKVEP